MATTPVAKTAVELNVDKFFAAFLPASDSASSRGGMGKNPFKSLENVDLLPEQELSELFVSVVPLSVSYRSSLMTEKTAARSG